MLAGAQAERKRYMYRSSAGTSIYIGVHEADAVADSTRGHAYMPNAATRSQHEGKWGDMVILRPKTGAEWGVMPKIEGENGLWWGAVPTRV